MCNMKFEFGYIVFFMTNVLITISENVFQHLPLLLYVAKIFPPPIPFPLTSVVIEREKKECENINAIPKKLGSHGRRQGVCPCMPRHTHDLRPNVNRYICLYMLCTFSLRRNNAHQLSKGDASVHPQRGCLVDAYNKHIPISPK